MRTYNFELCHMTTQISRLYGFTEVIKFIAYINKYNNNLTIQVDVIISKNQALQILYHV